MLENMTFFLNACKQLGMNEFQLFNPGDIAERKYILNTQRNTCSQRHGKDSVIPS